jgi:hypothetical protein
MNPTPITDGEAWQYPKQFKITQEAGMNRFFVCFHIPLGFLLPADRLPGVKVILGHSVDLGSIPWFNTRG